MQRLAPIKTILSTYLSKKPASRSHLVAASTIAFVCIASVVHWENLIGASKFLEANQTWVFDDHQYWRLFTCALIHNDIGHLLANAIGLAFGGYLLYGYFGFWVHPILSMLSSIPITLISLLTYSPNTILLGSSGIVYWIAGFWLVLYFFIDRRFDFGQRLIRVLGFAAVMLVPTHFEKDISHRTHAIGFGLGILFGFFYFASQKTFFRSKEVFVIEDSITEL